MKILFHDVVQEGALPTCAPSVKTPSLADTYAFGKYPLRITFAKSVKINSAGIGNFSGGILTFSYYDNYITLDGNGLETVIDGGAAAGGNRSVTFNGNWEEAEGRVCFDVPYNGSGLYLLDKEIEVTEIYVAAPAGSSVGRIALGRAVNIPTAVAKEPRFNSTSEPRRTLSGQIIPGAGGHNYMSVSLDSRYQIREEAFAEIKAGYKAIGAGYPFFINLETESYKLPFDKLHATETNQRQMSFESGARVYRYGRRWNFEEAF